MTPGDLGRRILHEVSLNSNKKHKNKADSLKGQITLFCRTTQHFV